MVKLLNGALKIAKKLKINKIACKSACAFTRGAVQ